MVTQTDDTLLVQMCVKQTSEDARSLWLSMFLKRGLIFQYRPFSLWKMNEDYDPWRSICGVCCSFYSGKGRNLAKRR